MGLLRMALRSGGGRRAAAGPTMTSLLRARRDAKKLKASSAAHLAEAVQATALIRTRHPLDGPAAVLAAALTGRDWAGIPEPERRRYRLDAAAVITAGQPPP